MSVKGFQRLLIKKIRIQNNNLDLMDNICKEPCDGNICGRKSLKLEILALIINIRKQKMDQSVDPQINLWKGIELGWMV